MWDNGQLLLEQRRISWRKAYFSLARIYTRWRCQRLRQLIDKIYKWIYGWEMDKIYKNPWVNEFEKHTPFPPPPKKSKTKKPWKISLDSIQNNYLLWKLEIERITLGLLSYINSTLDNEIALVWGVFNKLNWIIQ